MKLRLVKAIKLRWYGPHRFEVNRIAYPRTLGGYPVGIDRAFVEGWLIRDRIAEKKGYMFMRHGKGDWRAQDIQGRPKLVGIEIPSWLGTSLERRYRKLAS